MTRTLRFLIVALLLSVSLTTIPALAVDSDLQTATSAIEGAIQDAMGRSGQSGQPTLGQLGGVEGGSTDSDASGGAGGESSGGGGSGGGSGGGNGGGL